MIILLVEKYNSHNAKDIGLTNIEIRMLPPNWPLFQPFDAGIVHCFNAIYKEFLMKHYVKGIDRCKEFIILNIKEQFICATKHGMI